MDEQSQPRRLPGSKPGSGWRLPALAIVAALALLVGLARLGMRDGPSPERSHIAVASDLPATASPTVAPVPTQPPIPTPSPSLAAFLGSSSFGSFDSPWLDRYADGIPTALDGDPVHRVNEALNIAAFSATGESEPILIGGWYSPGQIADRPLGARGQSVNVFRSIEPADGAVVIRGVARTLCRVVNGRPVDLCLFSITSLSVAWEGDDLTTTDPIGTLRLLGGLAERFPAFDPQPYHDQATCRLPRPAQSYRSTEGPVSLVFIFRSADRRVGEATAVLNGPPFGDPASGCDVREPLDGKAGWISEDNVLIRVSNYVGPSGDGVRDVLDQIKRGAGG